MPNTKKGHLLSLVRALGILVLIILAIFNIFLYSKPDNKNVLGYKTVTNFRQGLLQEKLFWDQLLKYYPTYLPGWIELTKAEIQLENIEAAKVALIKAQKINPNLEDVIKLSELLGINN